MCVGVLCVFGRWWGTSCKSRRKKVGLLKINFGRLIITYYWTVLILQRGTLGL